MAVPSNFSFIKTFFLNVLLLSFSLVVYGQSNHHSSNVLVPELSAYNFGSLGKLAPLDQIEILKKTGYKGIILNSESKDDSTNLNLFLNELKNDEHFKIHAVMVRYNFTDALQKREGWQKIVNHITNKNIELWVIFGKKTEGFNVDFIEAKLSEMVAYAKAKKVKIILYPHSKCVMASAEEALPFVKKINNKNLKLAVHLCHEIRAGNGTRLNEVFDAAKGYIGAVTVAGTDSVADLSKPLLMDKSTIKPIGQGNFDMRKFIIPLRKSGYKSMVGFINFKIEEDPETYLKASMMEWKKQTNKLINQSAN